MKLPDAQSSIHSSWLFRQCQGLPVLSITPIPSIPSIISTTSFTPIPYIISIISITFITWAFETISSASYWSSAWLLLSPFQKSLSGTLTIRTPTWPWLTETSSWSECFPIFTKNHNPPFFSCQLSSFFSLVNSFWRWERCPDTSCTLIQNPLEKDKDPVPIYFEMNNCELECGIGKV